jgi:hypothetical protein
MLALLNLAVSEQTCVLKIEDWTISDNYIDKCECPSSVAKYRSTAVMGSVRTLKG